jgi:hypothetical protein
MDSVVITNACLIALAAILSVSIRGRRAAARLEALGSRLDEAIKDSEQTKRACFISLENMRRGLDALQSRVEAAEYKLADTLELPRTERKGCYQAAALLLDAGQSVERVAAMINLPAEHVTLVQELRRFMAEDGATTAKSGNEARPGSESAKKKRAPRAVREKVRPILLTDVVDFEAVGNRNGQPPSDHGAAA